MIDKPAEAPAPGDADGEPSTPQALGHHAARGFTWMIIQGLGIKAVSLAGQLVVSYLLNREVFGLMAITGVLGAFFGWTQALGLTQVLIHRQRQMRELQNAAFWLNLTAGLTTAVIYVATAPIAAIHYGQPEVKGLMELLALASIFEALWVVPQARLQVELRFRAVGLINLANGLGTTVLTVIFAALHFGAYMLILPRVIMSAIQTLVLWRLAPVHIYRKLELPHWKTLMNSAVFLATTTWLNAFIVQGDYFSLSLFCNVEEVGLYYFAFSLSTQTLQLLAVNMSSAFLSVFAKMGEDRVRQGAGFLRASRIVAAIGIPMCMLQGAVSWDIMASLFSRRWLAAAPLLAILSYGTSFGVLAGLYESLLQSQGRFRFIMLRVLVCAICFMGIVMTAAYLGSPLHGALFVSIGCDIYFALMWPICIGIALRWNGGRFIDAITVYLRPMAGFALCLAITFGIIWLAGFVPAGDWAARLAWVEPMDRLYAASHLLCIAGLSIPAYIWLLPYLDRTSFQELAHRIGALRNRLPGFASVNRKGT